MLDCDSSQMGFLDLLNCCFRYYCYAAIFLFIQRVILRRSSSELEDAPIIF